VQHPRGSPEIAGVESPQADPNATPLPDNGGPTKFRSTIICPECGHHVSLKLSMTAGVEGRELLGGQ